jgi:hypothetical protein
MEVPAFTMFNAGVDCLPRQPPREPSAQATLLLDEAIAVIDREPF